MIKKALVLSLLFVSPLALGSTAIPYGKAYSFDFCLYDFTDGVTPVTAITEVDSDIRISQSGTEANGDADDLADNGDCFSYTLEATETDTARINWRLRDVAGDVWFPIDRQFHTFGHPDAAIVAYEPYRFPVTISCVPCDHPFVFFVRASVIYTQYVIFEFICYCRRR